MSHLLTSQKNGSSIYGRLPPQGKPYRVGVPTCRPCRAVACRRPSYDIIQRIEDSPKLIGKTTGYGRHWNARATPEERAKRQDAQSHCQALLRGLGLSDEEIERWCRFSGVTIWQRLGLETGDWDGLLQRIEGIHQARHQRKAS